MDFKLGWIKTLSKAYKRVYYFDDTAALIEGLDKRGVPPNVKYWHYVA